METLARAIARLRAWNTWGVEKGIYLVISLAKNVPVNL